MKSNAMHVARDYSKGKARNCKYNKGNSRPTPTTNPISTLQCRLWRQSRILMQNNEFLSRLGILPYSYGGDHSGTTRNAMTTDRRRLQYTHI